MDEFGHPVSSCEQSGRSEQNARASIKTGQTIFIDGGVTAA
jgi:hypothetical protein